MSQHESTPRLTFRTSAFVLLAAVLGAFVAESQTAQYLQTALGYQQPYFISYIVHSSLLLSFPIHLIYILLKTKYGLRPVLAGLSAAVSAQMTSWKFGFSASPSVAKLVVLMICVTTFYNLIALLWFVAVPLTSVANVTAIWNANAFFAYLFSVKLLGVKRSALYLLAVTMATLGVLTVVYGGTTVSPSSLPVKAGLSSNPAPFIGDMLALLASVLYGLYQVLYKRYIALLDPVPPGHYGQISDSVDNSMDEETSPLRTDMIYPPPFGLYPNLITATIGVCTLFVFWTPIPILHYFHVEIFRLPPDASTVAAIAVIATASVMFNSGFMILLGIWGPIVTSVANLLTIVLTLISDVVFGTVALTPLGLMGTVLILCAFGILVYDMRSRLDANERLH